MQPDVLSRFFGARWPLLSPLVLGLAGVVCSVPLVWVMYQDVLVARSASVEVNAHRAASMSRPKAVSVDALTNAHFFGADASFQSPHQLPQEQVPETRMGLQLQGVIGSTVAEEARALIAQKGQRAKYYGVHDALPAGASVHSIAAEQVVLSRNGLLETLSFPKPQNHADNHALATVDNPAETAETVETAETTETDDSASQFQQLHESQVADYADDESSYAKSQPEESSQPPLSIKERLKQLRESRDL